jgi:trimeric autotransporter adhesin
MRINSSGNVGIGTSSPLAKLQITQSSSGSIVNALVLQNPNALVAGTGTKLYFSCVSDNLRGSYIESAATTNLNDTYLAFATNPAGFNATERMRITSSGNVGIGELNPEGLLHLTGDTNANGAELYLQVNNNNTTDNLGAINFGNNVDSTLSKILSGTSGASNSSYLTFSTSSSGSQSEAMRITSSGDVGIGTSLPVAKFHVTPTYNAGYTGSFSGVSSYNPTSSEILVGTFLGSAASAGDYTGIRFQINGNTSGIASASIIASREAAEGNGSTALSFLTRAGTGDTTERMRIDSTGNVGIGTSSPISKLSIDKTVVAAYPTYSNPSAGIDQSFFNATINSADNYNGMLDIGAVVGNTDASNGGSSIRFLTQPKASPYAAIERMRIDSTGNVLVGKTSADYNNVTRGNVEISGSSSAILALEAGSVNDYIYNSGSNFEILAGSGQGILFQTNGSSERMRIDSSGNVLVGTTTNANNARVKIAFTHPGAVGAEFSQVELRQLKLDLIIQAVHKSEA